MGLAIIVSGIILLGLRIWLTEFKLREALTEPESEKDEKFMAQKHILPRRHRYLSRMLAVYVAIAMMLDFQSTIMNLTVILPFFVMLVITVTFDFKFFLEFKQILERKNGIWLLIERITLHLPGMILTIIWLFEGLTVFTPLPTQMDFLWMLILTLGTFFVWDIRNPFSYQFEDPLGKHIFLWFLVSWAGWLMYFNSLA